jgi:3-oxoacyl-[acyl-carrier protein] reductase
MGRLGEPEDIASVIAFLVSDQATWITGQAISVNGGFGRS